MTDQPDWLDAMRAADPLRRESPWEAGHAARVRAVVLAVSPTPVRRLRPLPWVLAAVLVGIVGAGRWMVSLASPPARMSVRTAPVPVRLAPSGLGQLQFATPGGTRVIWTFNSSFE